MVGKLTQVLEALKKPRRDAAGQAFGGSVQHAKANLGRLETAQAALGKTHVPERAAVSLEVATGLVDAASELLLRARYAAHEALRGKPGQATKTGKQTLGKLGGMLRESRGENHE